MARQPNHKSPTQKLLRELLEAGTTKGDIAKWLDILPSAVTDLYAGRRQLKYDEGVVLANLLPGNFGKRLPVLSPEEAIDWEKAAELAEDFLFLPYRLSRTGAFIVKLPIVVYPPPKEGSEPLKVSDGAMAVVDPAARQLFGMSAYLVADGEKISAMWFQPTPARFIHVGHAPLEQPLVIGVDEFRVLGTIEAFVQCM